MSISIGYWKIVKIAKCLSQLDINGKNTKIANCLSQFGMENSWNS
jgi:hypothetical protein